MRQTREMHPVVLHDKKLAVNWWGKSWDKNLESYADYSNRIARGKTYIRKGAVLDLQIEKGHVTALVQGSRAKPYKVSVDIDPLSESRKKAILERCGGRIENLESLMSGEIPKDIEDIFVSRGGLFPSPDEIYFRCSCPDSAYMCKHVAAVLYGIGARFDEDPLLFFELRDFDVSGLIKRSVEDKLESMLRNADAKSPRVIDDLDAKDLFGVLRRRREKIPPPSSS